MDGNRITAEELVTHAAGLRRLAVRLVEDVAAAEDLVQQTLTVALERAPAQEHSLFPWLSRVLRNLALHRWRADASRTSREQFTARSERAPSAAELVERMELHRVVADEVLALPEPYRSAVLSLYFDEVSAEAYAKSVGLSPSTVRSHVSRGIELLRRRLDARSRGDRTAWTAALIALARPRAGAPVPAVGRLLAKSAAAFAAVAALVALAVWSLRPSPTASSGPAVANATVALAPDRAPAATEQRTPVGVADASVAGADPAAGGDATLDVLLVSKTDGAPIANARVDLERMTPGASYISSRPAETRPTSPGQRPSAGTTDADGRARFRFGPNERYRLRARETDAHGSAFVDLSAPGPGKRLEQRLEVATLESARMHGRVLSLADEKPVAGAKVEILPAGLDFGETDPTRPATERQIIGTDADGRFDLQLPAWTRRHVRVGAPGFVRALAVIGAEHADADRALAIRLRADGASLKLRAHDASGALLARASARAAVDARQLAPRDLKLDVDYAHAPPESWTAAFGPDGVAEFADLPSGVPVAFSILVDGTPLPVLPDAYQLAPAERAELDVTLGEGAAISGSVVDDASAPVAAQEIWLVAASETDTRMLTPNVAPMTHATSDDQGRFRFEGVSPGTWFVGIAPGGPGVPASAAATLAAWMQRVTIEAGQTEAAVELACFRGLFIRGRVFGPDGEIAPQVAVEARLDDRTYQATDTTAADGSFVLGPLVDGDYGVTAGGGVGAYAESEPVRVRAGATDVELRAPRGAPLRLRLVDRDRQPVRRVNVWWLRADPPGASFPAFWSSAVDGTFESHPLAAGDWIVVASVRNGPIGFARVSVPAGGTAPVTEIVLAPGGKLRLSYGGAKTSVRCRAEMDGIPVGSSEATPSKPATFTVPAGRLTLVFREGDDGPIEKREIEVAVGETKDVVFPPDR